MDVPITVRPEATTPIYLQIKYQLAHLITSGRLREGHRLPTVRTVAERLDVNPGTVAQAYRELQQQGLLEAAPGRGTFVAPTAPVDADAGERRRLLEDAVRAALYRARGLGFADDEVRQHLDLALASDDARPVLFAAPTLDIARKYATSLERRIGPALSVHPVTFHAIEARQPHVAALLSTAYFVVTFAGLARSVGEALERLGHPHRVIGCATEVQPHTYAALRALDPGARVCLATQEPYVPPTLNLLAEHTGRRAEDIEIVLDDDPEDAAAAFARADRVVYTFGARDLVIAHGVPTERRLEVTFDLTAEAVARVARVVFGSDVRSEHLDPHRTGS
jgi:DNA-binding transcriptional regulator YhcF (GntR family)